MDPSLTADEAELPPTSARARVLRVHGARGHEAEDALIEETPVALSYNGVSHAVMLASPADLEDFALGFSLSEGIIGHPRELHGLETHPGCDGVVIEMQIAQPRFLALKARRRALAGRTGCGLCGIESLAALPRAASPAPLPRITLTLAAIDRALQALEAHQPLRAQTGAAHAAAWATLDGTLRLVREDVGRHNALDKLVGAMLRAEIDVRTGFVLVSSRASYEMVQKALSAGIGGLVAVSAPTAMATRNAAHAGLILAGFARPGRLVAYAGADRIQGLTPTATTHDTPAAG
ncbi:MAG: formate dehydrogenase accessory sulfurtransferase FdhD [Candidatus Dactylopiibacterium sp.]|nr:formate dehydrogenase accessory sulfurtransferase FdhD [Candidatus Dactylopiibacterium sp.]